MGGPRIEPPMIDMVNNTWLDMAKSDRRITAQKVHSRVLEKLKQGELKGYTEFNIPSLRSFQEIIKGARKKYKSGLMSIESHKQGKTLIIDQEQPWNMSTLEAFELSPESIPFVLQAWRYSVALDEALTIRQAKWASRLCFQLKDKDIAEFWLTSIRYAREEQLSLLSGNPMKIYLLDSLLVMDEWERRTLEGTDIMVRPIYYIRHSFLPKGDDEGIQEEFFHALPRIDPSVLDQITDEDSWNRAVELNFSIRELPSSSKYFQDIEIRLIYLRHLSYMSKMPKWNALKPDEIKGIIVDLRQWVINHYQKFDGKYNPPLAADTASSIPPELAKWKTEVEKSNPSFMKAMSLLRPTPFPIEIYERAGYTDGYCQK